MADRFGNLITNITQTDLSSLKGGKRNIGLMIGTRKGIRVVKSYSDAFRSAVLALVNSHERLEISVRNGSAQKRLKARPGTRVVLGSYIGR
jgi:S-adenosylmethionine hydrolase